MNNIYAHFLFLRTMPTFCPIAEPGFSLAPAGPDYAQISIQINIVFSVYYVICEHYRQSRTHTQQHKKRGHMRRNASGKMLHPAWAHHPGKKDCARKKAAPKDGLEKGHVSSEKACGYM